LTSDRNKPSATLWATVVVVVGLMLYPLSLCPVIWILNRTAPPNCVFQFARAFYTPIRWFAAQFEPNPVDDLLRDLAGWWL
jgi:hypothetical protein